MEMGKGKPAQLLSSRRAGDNGETLLARRGPRCDADLQQKLEEDTESRKGRSKTGN